MAIDWSRPADTAAVRGTAALLRQDAPRTAQRRDSGLEGLEAATAAGGGAEAPASAPPTPEERIERLRAAIGEAASARSDAARDAGGAGRDVGREAAAEVVAGALSGLAKVYGGAPVASFTVREQLGLESVILTGGERPSLFVRNGFVDLTAPDIGDWDWALRRFEADIRRVVASVGRIDVPVKPGFAGSCFVLADGFVVTNRHVLEAIAVQDDGGAWRLNWPQLTTVDFGGEDGAAPQSLFRVAGVAFAGPDPVEGRIDFSHLDMAILEIVPTGSAACPAPVVIETDAARPARLENLYVVGFPGAPRPWLFDGVPEPGYETAEVLAQLFGGRFGVKRLAPGTVKAGPGDVPGDRTGWICTHDASTLGGNSGSCIADLTGGGLKVVGLHFGGANRAQNWAHATARLQARFAPFLRTV